MSSLALSPASRSHTSPTSPRTTVEILGVRVTSLGMEEVASTVVSWAAGECPSDGPRVVCATSVHGLIEADKDIRFRKVLNNAALITPDGMPLVWFGRLRGQGGMERVYGPTLMKRICQISASRRIRHFLYGGAPGVADELAKRLSGWFPGIVIAGTYCPPFRALTPEELGDVAERINASEADIVWVGLSTPKQERWVDSIRRQLMAKVLVTVGAAFDFHTGRVRQAPAWVQHAGLEWLFRLTQEPRRLWRRYAHNNPRFLALAALQLSGLRRFSD